MSAPPVEQLTRPEGLDCDFILGVGSAVTFSRDLRSRYIFTSLCWNIGLMTY